MKAITTAGLEYTYADGTVALSGVNFEASCGERIAVLGPNGSGKTTLFYHFNGLIRPTRGEIKVFGENICKDNIDMIRKRVGLVFQNPDSQLFAPTVSEDIAFGPKNLGLDPMELRDIVSKMLHRFDIDTIAQKNPASLSSGQKKRVAIAGVVAMEPDVLVLDEPTSGLDAAGITDTVEILDELNHEGKTIILSTHDSDLAASWADRVYVLNKGKVFRSGSPKHIFGDEKLIAEAGLKHPVIVQTFREFQARGLSKGEVPLSVLELMGSFDAKDMFSDLQRLAGNITVVRVPGIIEGGTGMVELKKIHDILDEDRTRKIGAMGTSAKVLMRRAGVRCDFEFDVIQSGMLAALRGFDVIIFASGGMASRVLEKVKEKNINCSCLCLNLESLII